MENIRINLSENNHHETLLLGDLISFSSEAEGVLLIVGPSNTNLFNLIKASSFPGLAYLPFKSSIEVMIHRPAIKNITKSIQWLRN